MIQIKLEAKKLKKLHRCNHIAALNMKAQELGYLNWEELSQENNVSRSNKKGANLLGQTN